MAVSFHLASDPVFQDGDGDLLASLKRAKAENRQEYRMRRYFSYSLLIIDEVGYLPVDPEAANLLFELIARRYEAESTIITTNTSLSKWGGRCSGTRWRPKRGAKEDISNFVHVHVSQNVQICIDANTHPVFLDVVEFIALLGGNLDDALAVDCWVSMDTIPFGLGSI